ncbi:CKLF-like MARVEL transmembrane domain-containing protein 4 [Ischnura elegans]|uniref:CKLF-like MARVEL transmembrane domain-containing protein 4 n=1 Tax=Ischnura elegans TaxID=197161 RepID=UPI001ED887F6|nr:CKLF-like MARVEL transmembrane domain-containing protein 4 [Ischnura elegans]
MMSSTNATSTAPPKTQSQAERGGGVGNGAGQAGSGSNALSWLEINVEYFKTPAGICKILELLFGIICMACASPAHLSGTHWFLFVVVTSFISAVAWTAIYLLSIRQQLSRIPIDWTLTEFLNTGVSAVLYVIAFLVQIIVWIPYSRFYAQGANIAAGVFGIFNAIVYWYATILLYNEYKDARAA